MTMIDMRKDTDNIVSGIYNTLERVFLASLEQCKGWGDLNPPNPKSEEIINFYISKIKLFIDYLASE